MNLDTIFFDLDDTLYPHDSGVWQVISQRIDLYLKEFMQVPADQVSRVRQDLFFQYGTTLRGLQITRQIDPIFYLNFVHQVPLHLYLHPNPTLRNYLRSLPCRRVIFTNSNRPYAQRVLEALGLADCFERIIDVLDLAPFCKPNPESYQRALALVGNPNPSACLMIDDAAQNVNGARRAGLMAIQVNPKPAEDVPLAISSIDDLPAALAKLGFVQQEAL